MDTAASIALGASVALFFLFFGFWRQIFSFFDMVSFRFEKRVHVVEGTIVSIEPEKKAQCIEILQKDGKKIKVYVPTDYLFEGYRKIFLFWTNKKVSVTVKKNYAKCLYEASDLATTVSRPYNKK